MVHTCHEILLAIKKNGLLMPTTMDEFKCMMLRGRKQTQKVIYWMIHFVYSRKGKSTVTETGWVATGSWSQGVKCGWQQRGGGIFVVMNTSWSWLWWQFVNIYRITYNLYANYIWIKVFKKRGMNEELECTGKSMISSDRDRERFWVRMMSSHVFQAERKHVKL